MTLVVQMFQAQVTQNIVEQNRMVVVVILVLVAMRFYKRIT